MKKKKKQQQQCVGSRKSKHFRQMKPEALKLWGSKDLAMLEDQGDKDTGVKRQWCKTDDRQWQGHTASYRSRLKG